jgi:hypothetical protein
MPKVRSRKRGERLVRISAGARRSRPQPEGEIPWVGAGRQKSVQRRPNKQAAIITSERRGHERGAAEKRLRGTSRSCRGEGTDSRGGPEPLLDLSGPGTVTGWNRVRRTRRGPAQGLEAPGSWRYVRHSQKVIGKSCAGKPRARFEREFLEAGRPRPAPR